IQRGKDPSLFVVLFEDSAAMLGLLVAFGGVFLSQITGLLWFDGLASIVIGLILGGTAAWLAYETKGLLIGESANLAVVDGIRSIAAACPGVERVHEVLTMHMGPDFILVNISVKFSDGTPAQEIESTIDQIDASIKDTFEHVKRVFIEAERKAHSVVEADAQGSST
ncbi:MAG: cation transporter dimerization domain-containing protein, partial [Pseudomonadales bacterium]